MSRWFGVIVVFSVWFAGCTLPDNMSRSASFGTYEQPRTPPSGTLAVGDTPILSRSTAWATLTNPRPASQQVLEQGAELYAVYCVVCHGVDGSGDGPVAEYFRRMPDLTARYIARYQDGRLYTIIRQGGFMMPAYASSLSADERWAVVHHLRTLGETQ